jgi:dienelactone hydrolase
MLAAYEEQEFTHDGKRKRVYRRGSGPGILIMHELPGMTEECIRLGDRLADNGFTTYLPLLFGNPGETATTTNYLRICLSREFNLFSKNKPSPIADWLRALCRHIHAECGGVGVGALGMCLTGGLALSMVVDRSVIAPVVSQPSIPLPAVTHARKAALGIPEQDVDTAAARKIEVLGLRFSEDRVCPKERFDQLQASLDGLFTGVGANVKSGVCDAISIC